MFLLVCPSYFSLRDVSTSSPIYSPSSVIGDEVMTTSGKVLPNGQVDQRTRGLGAEPQDSIPHRGSRGLPNRRSFPIWIEIFRRDFFNPSALLRLHDAFPPRQVYVQAVLIFVLGYPLVNAIS